MATISNVKDLLPLLQTIEPTDKPIAALEQRGHTLSAALKTRLKSGRTPTPAQLQLWKQAARQSGASRITVGQKPTLVPRALSPNEFEFSAGVRMSAANEILAGVYANGTIPNELFLDELLSAGDINTLQSLFILDRPGGRIGRLQITGPPRVTQISEGSDRVLVSFPYRLNFERITNILFRQIRTVVTFATGTIRLDVRLVAETSTDSKGSRNVVIQLDLSQGRDARLEVDPTSPVQLANPPAPGQIDLIAAILQQEIGRKLGNTLRLSVSATIPVPFGKLEIARVVVLTRSNALLVGMKAVGTVGQGDPANLVPLFPNDQTNLFTRVHDQVLRIIIQQAARNGVLTRVAKETHPDAVIDSADIAFGTNTI
ncbi:MAG TPA: hypothetical protein VFT26_04195, partial [Pyrinomonadaceae bacterium]|nr:hypothetical protein [Pyrinomonadaceae bacterium]